MGKWDTYYDDTAFLLPPQLPHAPNGAAFYGNGEMESVPPGLSAPDGQGWRYDDDGHIFKPMPWGTQGGHLYWRPAEGQLQNVFSAVNGFSLGILRPILSVNQRMCWRIWRGMLQQYQARSATMVLTGFEERGRPAWMAVCTIEPTWTPFIVEPHECGRVYPEYPPAEIA